MEPYVPSVNNSTDSLNETLCVFVCIYSLPSPMFCLSLKGNISSKNDIFRGNYPFKIHKINPKKSKPARSHQELSVVCPLSAFLCTSMMSPQPTTPTATTTAATPSHMTHLCQAHVTALRHHSQAGSRCWGRRSHQTPP